MKHDGASQCELVHIPTGLLHRRLVHSPPPTAKRRGAQRQFEPACVPGSSSIEGNNAVFGRTAKLSPPRCCREIALERAKSSAVLGVGDGKG
jgi:hypothetical protein